MRNYRGMKTLLSSNLLLQVKAQFFKFLVYNLVDFGEEAVVA